MQLSPFAIRVRTRHPRNHRRARVQRGSTAHLLPQPMLDLLQHMFGKSPRSGQLAAKDVNQRCKPIRRIFFQHIIARCFLCLARTVIIKRAHAGIGPDNIRASDRLLEIFAGCRAKIVGLAIGDRNLGRVT